MKLNRIETERLLLRELRIGDAEHIFKTWASDPRVTEFTNDTTDTSVEETREWLAVLIKQNEDDDSGVFCWGFELKSTGQLIGYGGATFRPDFQKWSLGYTIAFDYWNNGYATEAMKAVVAHLSEMGEKHFCSGYAVDNPASGRVMEKMGMKFWRDDTYTCKDGRVFEAKYYMLDID